MRPTTLLAVAGVAVLLTGCGGSDDGPAGREGGPPTADQLDDTTYASVEVTGHALVDGTQITLTFQGGNLAVNAGCNTMSAAYAVADGALTWTGPAASTLKACSAQLTKQDAWLSGLFPDGVEADLHDETLTLTTSDDAEVVLEAD